MDDDRRVIVIGSGPAGSMAAAALARRGVPVTHLESGRAVPRGLLVRALGTNLFRVVPKIPPRPYSRAGDPQSGVEDPASGWYSALVPGGLSNVWTGAVPRFAPEDFVEGGQLDEAHRWPLTYQDLVPYYDEAERSLVISAGRRDVPSLPAGTVAHPVRLPPRWADIARRAGTYGHGLVPLPLANGAPWMATMRGAAFNSYDRLVRPLACLPHYRLLLGAHATRLEWDGARRRVDSVVYVDRATGTEHRVRGAAVVIAAGALASTRLLLNSTSSDFPSGLGDDNGILGHYLHDHRKGWSLIKVDRPLPRLLPAAYLTRAPYGTSAPLMAAACIVGTANHGPLEKVLARTTISSRSFGIVTFGTMVPSPTNFVRLAKDVEDEFGLPGLDISLCFDTAVDHTSAAARERLLEILDASGYRPKVCNTVIDPPGASVHYGGTVRMHASPRYGMLNGWNRLHAVDNVVVADASSFTTGPEKHPTLTAMALAARACAKLADDLKRSYTCASGVRG